MSERKRQYVTDQNLGPVKLALVQQLSGGQVERIEGVEITFGESSPDMRNRFKFWFLFFLTLICMMGGIYFLTVGMFTAEDWWGRGVGYFIQVFPDLALAAAGGVLFLVLCFKLRPPFYGPVRVFMSVGDDRLSIYRNGKLADVVQTSHVRGVGLEPHPKLEESIAWAEGNPKRSDGRALINRYRMAQVLYLHIGQGVTTMKTEVAAFRESGQTPMRARSAVHIGWEMAMQLQKQAQGQGPLRDTMSMNESAAPRKDIMPDKALRSSGTPRRRRKGKIQ